MDANRSGAVDYCEFIAATLAAEQYTREDVCWNAFGVFDRDRSGSISRKEMEEANPSAKKVKGVLNTGKSTMARRSGKKKKKR